MISRRFSFALISILSIILLVFAVLATWFTVVRISDDLKQHLTSYLNISAASLSLPVWNFDLDTAGGVVDAVMLDKNITYARLLTDKETLIVRNSDDFPELSYEGFDNSWKFLKGSVPVLNDNEQIGTLELVLSKKAANRQMLLQFASILLLLGLIGAAITITSIIVTRRAISQPLAQLQGYASAIAAGDLDQPVEMPRDDEIGLLAKDLDGMRLSISDLFSKLQGSNDELEIANKTLEDRVQDRTLSVKQAQQRLVDAIDSAPDGVAIFDKDDRLILSNRNYHELIYDGDTTVAQAGMKFEEIVRRAAEKGLIASPGTDLDAFVAERVREHKQPGEPILQVRRDKRAIQISKSRTKEGGIVSIYSDLTDLKNNEIALAATVKELELARDEAMDATRAKSQFLANMSHELRTPLNAIIGYSELLHEEATDLGNKEFIPDLEKIRDAGKHLLVLINDILDLSKIEAGKMTVHIEEFRIDSMLDEVKSVIEPVLAKKGNTLEVTISDDLELMTSDLTKVRQNLFNLLSNAAKFTENGSISVDVDRVVDEEKTHWVHFRVADSGIGMTGEQLDSLFESFRQADSSISRDFGGSGLGLAITRQFCQLLGGNISASSELGLGSTFTVKLPLQFDSVESAPSAISGYDPHNGYKLLIIDDDIAVIDDLQDIFGKEGYQVITAQSGEEGLQMARQQQPDLITLDIVLPGMDGWSVLKTLKSDIGVRHIPVVVMTILGDKELGHALGAVDFVTKPIERDLVIETVERFRGINNTSSVMIVDDDANTRAILGRTLAPIGCSIVEAESGPAALQRVAESVPAVILLDIMMPGMDGFELLERLRSESAWKDISVIIISAKDLTEQDLSWLNARVSEIFQKGSYDRQHLLSAVSSALGLSSTHSTA